MADQEQLEIIKRGTQDWNMWREFNNQSSIDLSNVNFSGAQLSGINLSHANLSGATFKNADLTDANLMNAKLTGANLRYSDFSRSTFTGADLAQTNFHHVNLSYVSLINACLIGANLNSNILSGANLMHAKLNKANLSFAFLSGADLSYANLTDAILQGSDFTNANLSNANLSGADLTKAILKQAIIVRAKIEQAVLTECQIFGISAWGIIGVPKEQSSLIITAVNEAEITVDDIQVAQFIYLLLNNQNVRSIIDTITFKVVLILGNFKDERKAVLDAIREGLHTMNFTPIVFDFDKPISKDVTGTVETLARMARFIIADLTAPSSIPFELATIVPFLSSTPVLPIKLKGSGGFSMFEDLRRRYKSWVLETYEYNDYASLITSLPEVISPAHRLAESFRSII